MKAHGV